MVKKYKFGKMCKERMTAEVSSRFEKSSNFFITSYMGLTNAELETLRRALRKSSSSYFVVKNSILKVIFGKLKLETLEPMVDGGVGISFSGDDVISTCKTLVSFTREHDKLKVRAGYIDGQPVSAERIKTLASLPTRDLLLAQVVGGIKSPITGFVNVLGGVLRKLVYCLDAIRVERQKS